MKNYYNNFFNSFEDDGVRGGGNGSLNPCKCDHNPCKPKCDCNPCKPKCNQCKCGGGNEFDSINDCGFTATLFGGGGHDDCGCGGHKHGCDKKCCCPGPQGLSAYQVAVKNGYIGTEEQWLASLKGDKGEPGSVFLSGYAEALATEQSVAPDSSIAFDATTLDATSDITLGNGGTIFNILRPGLYSVQWSLNLAQATPAGVVGMLENGEAASGAASSAHGNFSSGAIINVETVPFALSLHNFGSAITIEEQPGFEGAAGSMRIIRFAEGINA